MRAPALSLRRGKAARVVSIKTCLQIKSPMHGGLLQGVSLNWVSRWSQLATPFAERRSNDVLSQLDPAAQCDAAELVLCTKAVRKGGTESVFGPHQP